MKRGCITQPGECGLQARIKCKGKEHRKYFAFNDYAPGVAELAAKRWLVRKARELPQKSPVRERAQANNATGVSGVSRTIQYDSRKDKHYVRYQVHWHNGEKQRNKGFAAGNADVIDNRDEAAAFEAACAFRQAYVEARLSRKRFDPRPWLNWKARLAER
jgi:hypothetical protein